MIERKDCPMRHENGNCMPVGGFCTAVNDAICEAVHSAYRSGASDANSITSKALNEAARLLTSYGYCTHYPGCIRDI